MIKTELIQETLNYLTTKPWREVNSLIEKWDEAMKKEKEDAGDSEIKPK